MDDSSVPAEFKCPISLQIMKDPAILACGHTFDRPSINTWLSTCNECPTCRKPVNTQEISTNYSMKSMITNLIESQKPQTATSSWKFDNNIKVDNQVELKAVGLDALKEIKGQFYEDESTGLVEVSLLAPSASKRRAVAFVCVVDVSGSMGSIVGAGEGGKAFTRLDLVKHVLNVLIVSLTEQDTLTLITFSTETRLVGETAFMTEENKAEFRNKVRFMQTENSTYTGQAIKLAYEMVEKSPSECVKSIILLTDGQDSEGNTILERKFTVIKKDPQVQFNTFGFSNDIISDVLEKLATIGNGIFGYIPDQSMIGTIFINFIANTFNIFAQNVQIKIDEANFEFINKTEPDRIVLRHGCARHFLLKRRTKSTDAPIFRIGFSSSEMVGVVLEERQISETFTDQFSRYKMLELLQDMGLELHELKAYEKVFKKTPLFLKELNQGREGDMNNEQIRLAFENWGKWGGHYVRSFKFAHLNEQTLNFKAPSMKIYRDKNFDDRVDNLTDLFCTLPPPKPTGFVYVNNNAPQVRVSMRNIMDSDAGCILGTCKIKLANNRYKQLIDVRKGDILEDGSEVICNLKTKFKGEMVKINNLVITPYHPIIYNGEWQLPVDVVIQNSGDSMKMIRCDEPWWVCTLVLNKNHVMNVEGVKCITLGHGFTDAVLRHEYYGTNKVIENLKEMEGWENGEIVLGSYRLKRDRTGCVIGMMQPVYVR